MAVKFAIKEKIIIEKKLYESAFFSCGFILQLSASDVVNILDVICFLHNYPFWGWTVVLKYFVN